MVFAMSQDWIIDHVKKYPPRCLAGFAVDHDSPAARAVLVGEDAPNARRVMFSLGTRGPADRPTLLGHFLDRSWPEDCAPFFSGRLLVSPLFLRWEMSNVTVPI